MPITRKRKTNIPAAPISPVRRSNQGRKSSLWSGGRTRDMRGYNDEEVDRREVGRK